MVLEITKNQGGLNWPTAMNLTAEQAQEQEQADEQARLRAGQLPDTLALSLDMLLEREGAARVGAAPARPEPKIIPVDFTSAGIMMGIVQANALIVAGLIKVNQFNLMSEQKVEIPYAWVSWANGRLSELEREFDLFAEVEKHFVTNGALLKR